LQRAERRTLIALAAVTLVLRAIATFRYRFDSDEPQHLHVAWGWASGLVQYRDLFDNHAPLFHMLSAPLVRLLGERDDILRWMRVPMVPLFIIVVACTWILARRFWSERVALWSLILLCTFAPYFLKSIEYRTDNLWTAVWMIALVLLTSGAWFAAGVVLGIALCVSLKTMLLIITAGLAAIITAMVRDERRSWRPLAMAAAGFVIAPAIVATYFVKLGAWQNLLFCVFRFNELVTHGHNVILPRVLYVFFLFFVVWRARHVARTGDIPRTRFFLGLCAAIFSMTMFGFWVLIGPRDFLAIMPLFAIMLTASILRRWPQRAVAIFTSIAIFFLVCTAYYTEWFRDQQRETTTMLHQVLRLTRPGEYLMDYKGETVFRRRPYYFIFEKIGRDAMRLGLLRDTVGEAMVRTKCHVAQADGAFWPPRARAFLDANFLDVGRLRASGQWLHDDGKFSIAVDGDYVIIVKDGQANGTLDGTPYTGARYLAIGEHRFLNSRGERVAVFWGPAFERGFSPFHLQDLDF
jgi:MFS family permease